MSHVMQPMSDKRHLERSIKLLFTLKNQHGINDGVEVLHRSDYNYSEVADGIKDTITLFADKSEKEIKEIRKRAAEVAEQALWKHFIQYYYEAYDIALCNAMKRQLS